MRALFLFALIAAVNPDRPNPTPREPPKTLQELILGDWEVVRMSIGGGGDETMKKDEVRTLRFLPKEIQVLVNGELRPEDGANYTLDITKKPAALDFTPKNGMNMKIQGILKLEGDQLVLCFAIGGDRPADFTTSSNPPHALMFLRRVKR